MKRGGKGGVVAMSLSLMVAFIAAGALVALTPTTAGAAPPTNTVNRKWVVSIEEIGYGYSTACFNLDAGNWAGRYKKLRITEGWIYEVRIPGTNRTYWVYAWNRHGGSPPTTS